MKEEGKPWAKWFENKIIIKKTNLLHRWSNLHTGLMPISADNPIYALHKTWPNLMSKCLSEECCKARHKENFLNELTAFPQRQRVGWRQRWFKDHTCLWYYQPQTQILFQIFQLYAFQQASSLKQPDNQ